MLIEALESALRAEAATEAAKPHPWARASAMGYCPRRLGYQKLGVIGEPLTPRRMSILGDGIAYDLVLKDRIARVLKDRVIDGDFLGDNFVEIEGVKISYHIDMAIQLDDGRIGIVELKTCADMTFDRALKGQIDEAYACQAWTYSKATGFPVVIFLFYRKSTSHLAEVIFDSEAQETVVTRRYGGDERAIQLNDPLLIAEVRNPFDASISGKVTDTINRVTRCDSLATLPIGVNAIEAETIKIQGADKAKAKAEELGIDFAQAEKSGSWFGMKTGRKVVGWPCNYCPFKGPCLNPTLEIDNGRPKWVIG